MPALCTGHTCRADAQLAAPGGQERLTPHFLTPLCSYTVGTPAIPARPHPSCSAEGSPLITQTRFTFSTAKPGSSAMISQHRQLVGNTTILLFQGSELLWEPLSCLVSRGEIPHPHPREVSGGAGGDVTSGWVWTPISGLTMAHLALPSSPSSTTRQASTGNHSGGKRPPGSPSWSINGGTESPNPVTAIPSSAPSPEGLGHA